MKVRHPRGLLLALIGSLALALPAAAVLVLALAAMAAEARTLRRRGVTGMLRVE